MSSTKNFTKDDSILKDVNSSDCRFISNKINFHRDNEEARFEINKLKVILN